MPAFLEYQSDLSPHEQSYHREQVLYERYFEIKSLELKGGDGTLSWPAPGNALLCGEMIWMGNDFFSEVIYGGGVKYAIQ